MRDLLRQMFEAAVAASHPARAVPPYLPPLPAGRLVVVGAGKGAAAMAAAVEAGYGAQGGLDKVEGLVIAADGCEAETSRIEVAYASHPIPDARGVDATQRILKLVSGLGPDDLALVLISGGASALLCAGTGGITLADKQAVTRKLFDVGAPIEDLNAIRMCLSAVKGGRLAQACWPAKVVTLAISDVVGDDPSLIGSGPTVQPRFSAERLRYLVETYGGALNGIIPQSRLEALFRERQAAAAPSGQSEYHLIATPKMALEAAGECAASAGFTPVILGDDIAGEAGECARDMAHMAVDYAERGKKTALISGGEVTVSMGEGHNNPDGGPNREFALSFALALQGHERVHALIADSDGIDGKAGPTGVIAGAFVEPETLKKAQKLGISARAMLETHNSGRFFAAIGDEFAPGPTNTNVNDLRLILTGAK